MKAVLCKPLLSAFLMAAGLGASAAPIVESGKTVEHADFSLTFDMLFTGYGLEGYEENGIFATTAGSASAGAALFYGDGRTSAYHYALGGNDGYTTIRGVNDEVFGAADFLLGNGWAMQSNYMRYSTYLDGELTGTGVAMLESGTVRISDLGGFDELHLNSHYAHAVEFGQFQGLALDDLHLQLWSAPASTTPEPGQVLLFGAGLLALHAARRRFPA